MVEFGRQKVKDPNNLMVEAVAVSAAKTGKTVKNIVSRSKIATTLNRAAQNAVISETVKKTAQTLGRQQKRVGSSACFTAGTKIHTKDGFKNIEAIKAGDYVWSENPETHEKALKKVKKIFVREKDSIIRLAINGEVIETTAEHLFYVEGKGFTAAGELKAGDEVRLESGEEAFVESTEEIQLSEPVKVYNFEVEDFHTYYVSEQKVLVHNTCDVATSNILKYSINKQLVEINTKSIGNKYGITVENLNMSKTVLNHADDIITKGNNKGMLSRPYINSNGTTLLLSEIIKGSKPKPDLFLENGLRWDTPGTFRKSRGTWELVVDMNSKEIVHFNFVTK